MVCVIGSMLVVIILFVFAVDGLPWPRSSSRLAPKSSKLTIITCTLPNGGGTMTRANASFLEDMGGAHIRGPTISRKRVDDDDRKQRGDLREPLM